MHAYIIKPTDHNVEVICRSTFLFLVMKNFVILLIFGLNLVESYLIFLKCSNFQTSVLFDEKNHMNSD